MTAGGHAADPGVAQADAVLDAIDRALPAETLVGIAMYAFRRTDAEKRSLVQGLDPISSIAMGSPPPGATMLHMRRIGIRELRQNASEYVRAAEAGETLEVTDRGRPVAHLAPLPKGESVLDRLIAEGKATPARGDLRDLGPPLPRLPGERPLSENVEEMREDRI